MEILLVRHGEPVTAESLAGPVDPELTARGRWQAECLGAWLACEPIDHVITSSKRRAIEAGEARLRTLHEIAHFDGQRDRALGPEGDGFPAA